MREMIKKIFVATVVSVIIAIPVFAEEMSVESTLVYTCEDSFFVSIPETIVVGEPSYVEATDINIAPGKTVYVDIASPNDYVEISSVNDSSNQLHVFFQNAEGTAVTVMNPSIATFEYGESGDKEFNTYIENATNAIAGDYSGSVMFNIRCE